MSGSRVRASRYGEAGPPAIASGRVGRVGRADYLTYPTYPTYLTYLTYPTYLMKSISR